MKSIRRLYVPKHLAFLAVKGVVVGLKKIKAVFTDVDGVLTDGRVFYGPGGESVAFHIQDGIGQRLLQRAGIPVFWVSARSSPAVTRRARRLGVACLYPGDHDKVRTAEKVCRRRGWRLSEIAFLGDDLVDLPLMEKVGWAVAPADARLEVKRAAHLVTKAPGGHGAFREAAERLLKAQGRWARVMKAYLNNPLP
jgi:3-deoxy-D-manno-octulosonate 8-phosphate phosphatase (KDO 8-P phosphatase)